MNQLFFTVNAYIALAAVLINLVFAVIVIARTSRNIIFITFFFICISVALWNFGDFMVYATGNRLFTMASEGASIWKYLSSIGSAMAPAFTFHFINTLVFPGGKKNTAWITLAYIFSSLLALSAPMEQINPLTQKIIGGVVWNILFLLFLFPFIIWGILLVVSGIKRSEYANEKSRLRYLLAAIIIALITGITDLVQKPHIPVPPLGHLGSVTFTSILAIGVFKHRRDFDVLAQTRKRLEVLGEMAAGIAHEIKNPLSSIKGASILLADELKSIGQPKIRELHSIISEEIERLNIILTNFQDLTKPLQVEKDVICVNEVIRKTVKLAELENLNMKIHKDLSEDVPKIKADSSLLKQVFINLIKNSFEACGTDCDLVIKTQSDSPWVKIIFIDDGPSIPPEIAPHIFKPFFTTKKTGMGLGLSICKRIVEAHNGQIEVKNLLPHGTEFAIFFPA
jgi:signal transduction histidine kinase